MPKSKNNKSHKSRLKRYKSDKKKEQDLLKKQMIERYMKMQQESIANKEAHTSTEEVSGPEIDIDELNKVEESGIVNMEEPIVDMEEKPINIVNMEEPIDMEEQIIEKHNDNTGKIFIDN